MADACRASSSFIRISLLAVAIFPFLTPIRPSAAATDTDRGRYLSIIGGCNDCHTAGYLQSAGNVPEKNWLMGDTLGWRGPWGTTYAPNLRLFMSKISEDDWLKLAKEFQPRPPMPWFNIRHMTDPDLRALYRFVRSLKPLGKPAPEYLPPDKAPPRPFVQMP